MFPKLRLRTSGATVDFGFAFCVKFVSGFMFILVWYLELTIMGGFVYWFGCSLPFFFLIYTFFFPFSLFVNVYVYASLCILPV